MSQHDAATHDHTSPIDDGNMMDNDNIIPPYPVLPTCVQQTQPDRTNKRPAGTHAAAPPPTRTRPPPIATIPLASKAPPVNPKADPADAAAGPLAYYRLPFKAPPANAALHYNIYHDLPCQPPLFYKNPSAAFPQPAHKAMPTTRARASSSTDPPTAMPDSPIRHSPPTPPEHLHNDPEWVTDLGIMRKGSGKGHPYPPPLAQRPVPPLARIFSHFKQHSQRNRYNDQPHATQPTDDQPSDAPRGRCGAPCELCNKRPCHLASGHPGDLSPGRGYFGEACRCAASARGDCRQRPPPRRPLAHPGTDTTDWPRPTPLEVEQWAAQMKADLQEGLRRIEALRSLESAVPHQDDVDEEQDRHERATSRRATDRILTLIHGYHDGHVIYTHPPLRDLYPSAITRRTSDNTAANNS